MSRGERKPSWGGPEERVRCVRCLEQKDPLEVDRLGWCDDCKRLARKRAGSWGWVGGFALGAGVAAYVWLVVRPSMLIQAWIATIAAAIWIGSRVWREIIYGVMRFLDTRGVEAARRGEAPRG